MRNAVLLPVLLLAGACASAPSTDARSSVPDRPEVPRPEGVEPEGLAEVRNAIGEQRAEARARDNALNVGSQTLSQNPQIPWYESALNSVADTMKFLRNMLK